VRHKLAYAVRAAHGSTLCAASTRARARKSPRVRSPRRQPHAARHAARLAVPHAVDVVLDRAVAAEEAAARDRQDAHPVPPRLVLVHLVDLVLQ
jgi:hypothetical protein